MTYISEVFHVISCLFCDVFSFLFSVYSALVVNNSYFINISVTAVKLKLKLNKALDENSSLS